MFPVLDKVIFYVKIQKVEKIATYFVQFIERFLFVSPSQTARISFFLSDTKLPNCIHFQTLSLKLNPFATTHEIYFYYIIFFVTKTRQRSSKTSNKGGSVYVVALMVVWCGAQ